MTAGPRSVFAVRDFRLLWVGEAVSALGDQFAMIALPWLALLVTGSAVALGTVLALMAVPRAVLMLVGGAYVDRLSPRRVMLLSNIVRLVAVGLLGGVVLAGAVQLWMLYGFALVFGVADAFFYPAQTAIVPDLVDSDQLQRANGITQGTTQLTVLAGPAVAGLAIALLGNGSATASGAPNLVGVGISLLLDAATFVVSLVTLLAITKRPRRDVHAASVGSQIVEGIRFVWHWPSLLTVMILSSAANLLIVGPFEVGFPVLAYTRFPEGAVAFGLMVSAFGGGSVVGMALASVLPLPPRRFGPVVLITVSFGGFLLAAISLAQSTVVAIVVTAFIGVTLGYTNLTFMTWTQRRIPRALMGRVMSLMMFSSVALVPISIAVAGFFVEANLNLVLVVAGLGMAVLALSGLISAKVRNMGLEPAIEEPEESTIVEATAALAT
jgi:MFS family permease